MTIIRHGFELLREQDIPELNTRARWFRHQRTGLELLSMENDEENKVFGITFVTPPTDSTGVPHILEHAVLGGSRKYPVKEPFVELMKSSLNTFLNAFTASDKTMYPVASQNLQDFYNLVDVYLDAVFYPNITPHTLDQEGWHYELESLDEPLRFKGVVFNEMKGAYSSPDSLLYRYTQQSLFPDTTYGVDSGGDPVEIPNLTYAQFKSFHKTYYHPSNARVWFYGDDDPDERLRLIDAFIQDFGRNPVRASIDLQARFSEPREVRVGYAVEDGSEQKSMVTFNWLMDEYTDPETSLGLAFLDHILMGTPAAPLRKALIDSGLGEDVAGGGLNDHVRQMFFSVGLKGIQSEDAPKVEQVIFDTLRGLAADGIDPAQIEASMNTIEFSLREYNTGGFPRGLAMMLSALGTWAYGHDPLALLAFEAPLAAVKARVENSERYFESLIERYFLDNSHRTCVLLEPDPEKQDRDEAAEMTRLVEARDRMTKADLEAIIRNTAELKRLQEKPDTPEALATIPVLTLDDLDRENKPVPLAVQSVADSRVLYHDLFTNGIVYLDIGFDLHALPQEYLPFVSLFGWSLLEIGTETEDYVRLSQRIGRKTGGIRPTTFVSSKIEGDDSSAWFFLRSKATVDQTGDLLDILRDMLLTVKLDNRERFRQMLLEEKAGQEAGLVPGGHGVVSARLGSRFTEAGWANEQMGGISYLFFLRELVDQVENDWPSVLAKLEAVRQHLITRGGLLVNITIDQDNWTQIEPQLVHFVSALPDGDVSRSQWQPDFSTPDEGLTIPAQVNYVGKSANLYATGYSYTGAANVVTGYLRRTYLWDKIRVQGGAYGAPASFSRNSGIFTFLSYRDPNLLRTLDVYDGAGQFLRDLDLSDSELSKAIISTIGSMDSYQLPDAKGYSSMTRYLTGYTDALRQQTRNEVLATTTADFKTFGDALNAVQDSKIAVLGSVDAIKDANAQRGTDWLHITKVL